MSDRHESWVRGTMGGGQGCKCSAKSEVECGCPDVDWTSKEVYDLRAEVAALKAQRDPLAEMWRELEAYQPMADRDGHGESWAKMCRERTDQAAWDAAAAARFVADDAWAAEDAARAAASAASRAASAAERADDAIAAIRRAKEGR